MRIEALKVADDGVHRNTVLEICIQMLRRTLSYRIAVELSTRLAASRRRRGFDTGFWICSVDEPHLVAPHH
jgi:hypothetical protein